MLKRLASLTCALGLVTLTAACAKSDAGITTSVKSKMAADDTVKAYQIDVDTKDGVVTLTGTVPTPTAKEQAIIIARSTDGVRSVVDNLDVGSAAERSTAPDETAATAGRVGEAASDATITAAVKTKFLADTDVAGLAIDVDTSNGVVTLSGKVKTPAEKAEAIRLARETDGVKEVVDKLTVGR
jgi:hyperosmotically inducible protein